jgi:hypothetical protein
LKHTVSQIAQLSKSLHQRSIWAAETARGSSIIDATIRASYQPLSQSRAASPWFVPSRLASTFICAIGTPKALLVWIP